MDEKIKLGAPVKFKLFPDAAPGVCTGRAEYLDGSVRYEVSQQLTNGAVSTQWVDASQVVAA